MQQINDAFLNILQLQYADPLQFGDPQMRDSAPGWEASEHPGRLNCRCLDSDPNNELIKQQSEAFAFAMLFDRNGDHGEKSQPSLLGSLTDDQRSRITQPPREVVIYSDEELRENADLEVPLQIRHITTNPVIPSSLASVTCASLGVDGLLKQLNEVMRTTYAPDFPGLLPHLQRCITRNYDFGTAFGRLRSYCNRVLPTWVARGYPQRTYPWAVSHSWMEEKLRHKVETPINGYEWLVPIPTDTTLDRVRVELLNLGAEYAWLDVLCLRQEDSLKPEKEALREEEWKSDVPTIGSIYKHNENVVSYFNGLGRPFEVADTTNERHWTRRAWVLQEAKMNTVIGGLRKAGFPLVFPPQDARDVKFHEDLIGTLSSGNDLGFSVFAVLETMLKRAASFEVDRIAGLAYILRSDTLPAYVRGVNHPDAHERAWNHLVMTMGDQYRLQLMFKYPIPGDGSITWRPSWSHLSKSSFPLPAIKNPLDIPHRNILGRPSYGVRDDGSYKDSFLLLRDCAIQDLGEHNGEGYCRQGKLIVKVDGSVENVHSFSVEAHHQQPIPDDQTYVLVGLMDESIESVQELVVNLKSIPKAYFFWMVGIQTDSGSIRKVSVLQLENEEERNRLRELSLITEAETILV